MGCSANLAEQQRGQAIHDLKNPQSEIKASLHKSLNKSAPYEILFNFLNQKLYIT
jgi:hypothetical protein